MGSGWLQHLMRSTNDEPASIPTRLPGTKSTTPPMCVTCQYARQCRKGAGVSIEIRDPTTANALKKDNLSPGERVSMDHYTSTVRGRLPNT